MNISRFFSSIAVSLTMFSFAVSCEQKESELPEPVFPEKVVDVAVVPGTELRLTFKPDTDWTVSVPEDNLKWFWIVDGADIVFSQSGPASDSPVTVIIGTRAEETLELHGCEVTLTMGGKSKVIAEYMLKTKDVVLNMYPAVVSEGDFVVLPGTDDYQYADEEVAEIELMWSDITNGYRFPVKIESNIDWTIEWPEWARADLPEGSKAGTVKIDVYGVPTKIPLTDAEGDIIFRSAGTELKRFRIRIKGCLDRFSYSLSNLTSVEYDHAGYRNSENGGYSNDVISGHLYGPQGVRVVVAEMTDGGYQFGEVPWVVLDVAEYEDNTDVLQSRNVTLSVPRYYGDKERQAVIFFLPASFPSSDLSVLLTSEGNAVNPDYAENAVMVTQTARPEGYITLEYDEVFLEAAGVIFDDEKEFSLAGIEPEYTCTLTYTKNVSRDRASFYLTDPYKSYTVYRSSGEKVEQNEATHWLSFTLVSGELYGVIEMDSSRMAEGTNSLDGYIAFEDADGNVLCLVHCCYVAEVQTPEDVVEDASFLFVNPEAAKEVGATLVRVLSGPTYQEYIEDAAPIYILTYTKDNTSLRVKTSEDAYMYSCVGKSVKGPEMVTIDNQMFYDHEWYRQNEKYLAYLAYQEYLKKVEEGYDGPKVPYAEEAAQPDYTMDRSTVGILTFGATSFESREYPGESDIRMNMPEGVVTGNMKETIKFANMNSMVLCNFVCVLNFN